MPHVLAPTAPPTSCWDLQQKMWRQGTALQRHCVKSGFSEKVIVEHFKNLYIDNGIWNSVLVGNNSAFDFCFMKYKLKHYFGLEELKLGQRPNPERL